jgi:hypothetical protein
LVVVIDSGMNEIPQLKNIVVTRDKDDDFFLDPDDDYGHGTPIGYLVAFGENSDTPRARVISYKVWSETNKNNAHLGVIKALDKYGEKTKLFTSSIIFPDESGLKTYFEIDKKVQNMNAVMVYSAGNIPKPSLKKDIERYPHYLAKYPVDHPALGVSIAAVGSITKHASNKFAADIPSPFTIGESPLFGCIKPEVAEHGGNLDCNLNCAYPSILAFDGNVTHREFCGTSFSAPLFIGKIAEINHHYKQITNAEALKAIALISCTPSKRSCVGYGEPQRFIGCNPSHALWVQCRYHCKPNCCIIMINLISPICFYRRWTVG